MHQLETDRSCGRKAPLFVVYPTENFLHEGTYTKFPKVTKATALKTLAAFVRILLLAWLQRQQDTEHLLEKKNV